MTTNAGVSTTELARFSDDEVADQVTRIAAQISAATYRFLVLLAELDRRRPWSGYGIVSTAHWLNVRCGIDLVAASEKVRVARALEKLPLISAAFARGEVSYSKVRAMTRAAEPENEDYFLNIAKSGTATHVERLVRLYRRCERKRLDQQAGEQFRDRELKYWKLADGSLRFEGRLPADAAAVFLKALEAARDAMREAERGMESPGEFPAGSPAASVEGDAPSASDADPVAAQRDQSPAGHAFPAGNADALLVLAETMLAHGPAAMSGGDRYEVVVHVAEGVLPANGDGPAPELESGTALAPESARRIACDCSRICVHEDEAGEILSVGRKTRQIPPAIRRTLRSRDRGCRFPGCANRRFVDAHHIEHWADGGETKLRNLVLLCRVHHTMVHEGGWLLRLGNEGLEFVRDDGAAWGPVPLAGDEYADTLEAFERAEVSAGIRIDAHSIIPEWYGEPMNYVWAIDALYDRKERLRRE